MIGHIFFWLALGLLHFNIPHPQIHCKYSPIVFIASSNTDTSVPSWPKMFVWNHICCICMVVSIPCPWWHWRMHKKVIVLNLDIHGGWQKSWAKLCGWRAIQTELYSTIGLYCGALRMAATVNLEPCYSTTAIGNEFKQWIKTLHFTCEISGTERPSQKVFKLKWFSILW